MTFLSLYTPYAAHYCTSNGIKRENNNGGERRSGNKVTAEIVQDSLLVSTYMASAINEDVASHATLLL